MTQQEIYNFQQLFRKYAGDPHISIDVKTKDGDIYFRTTYFKCTIYFISFEFSEPFPDSKGEKRGERKLFWDEVAGIRLTRTETSEFGDVIDSEFSKI